MVAGAVICPTHHRQAGPDWWTGGLAATVACVGLQKNDNAESQRTLNTPQVAMMGHGDDEITLAAVDQNQHLQQEEGEKEK